MVVLALTRQLPKRYVAPPRVHSGSSVEIDVATYEKDEPGSSTLDAGTRNGGVAIAVWAPPRPTLTVVTDLPALDEYEVRVYDTKRCRRLITAVEIASPANKDRPEQCSALVAKCVALLEQLVSVTMIDLVSTRTVNLYRDLLETLGKVEPFWEKDPPALYAVVCRNTKKDDSWLLESWAQTLTLGQPLPTLPLWLADNLAVPLDLEACYEETCRALRIP